MGSSIRREGRWARTIENRLGPRAGQSSGDAGHFPLSDLPQVAGGGRLWFNDFQLAPEGSLYGETAVFNGALSMTRREAADLAAAAGCDVGADITKATTLLIVSDQDVTKLAGHTQSSKHRKAEKQIEKEQPIRIPRETDFIVLLGTDKAGT